VAFGIVHELLAKVSVSGPRPLADVYIIDFPAIRFIMGVHVESNGRAFAPTTIRNYVKALTWYQFIVGEAWLHRLWIWPAFNDIELVIEVNWSLKELTSCIISPTVLISSLVEVTRAIGSDFLSLSALLDGNIPTLGYFKMSNLEYLRSRRIFSSVRILNLLTVLVISSPVNSSPVMKLTVVLVLNLSMFNGFSVLLLHDFDLDSVHVIEECLPCVPHMVICLIKIYHWCWPFGVAHLRTLVVLVIRFCCI
jgi:hypothetical protein